MDISNAAKAKYTELLNSAASVVETIKSSAQDSLPALSSTVRTIASLTTVGALVVACLQWKDANRFAEGANKLSLMAFCEEFPHRQHDPECKSLLNSAIPPLSQRSLANISAPVNQCRSSDALLIIIPVATYLCALLAIVWILRNRHRRQTLEVDPEQLTPLHTTTCCYPASSTFAHSVLDMRVRGGEVTAARVGHR